MAKILSEKAQEVLTYLQNNQAVPVTKAALGEALGYEPRSINGVVNGLKRNSTSHVPLVETQAVEGTKDIIVVLTPEGAAFDPAADKPEKEAE